MKIFLDDIRNINDAYKIWPDETIFLCDDWVIVRNYDQFVELINDIDFNDIDFISFDNDLGDVETNIEKTGYDAVKWLVDYCMDNDYKFPPYFVHSQNPVGNDNIKSYIENYKRLCQD